MEKGRGSCIFMDGIFLILMGDMRKRMICHGIMKKL